MKNLLIIFLVMSFFSCKKAEERKCFKTAGELSERVVETDMDIDTLLLYDDLYYTLEQGSETKIVLSGGENLLPHINVEFNKGKLTMNNENKCRFLRSYKEQIHAKLIVDSVTYIHYEGSRELTSKDTLYSNELRLVIRDGAGTTDLTLVNGYTSAVITHGFGDFTLRGNTLYSFLKCSTNSFCDTQNFTVKNSLNVFSNTVGKMKINANDVALIATIKQSGNIEYIGVPNSKTLKIEGSGEVISLNN